MRFFCVSVAAAIVALTIPVSVNAKTLNKTVNANQTSYITALAIYDTMRCRGMARPKLARWSADHGEISVRHVKQIIPKGDRCAGNTFYYLVVDYTPKKGFRGKDTAKFTLSSPRIVDGSGRKVYKYKVNITVN